MLVLEDILEAMDFLLGEKEIEAKRKEVACLPAPTPWIFL